MGNVFNMVQKNNEKIQLLCNFFERALGKKITILHVSIKKSK